MVSYVTADTHKSTSQSPTEVTFVQLIKTRDQSSNSRGPNSQQETWGEKQPPYLPAFKTPSTCVFGASRCLPTFIVFTSSIVVCDRWSRGVCAPALYDKTTQRLECSLTWYVIVQTYLPSGNRPFVQRSGCLFARQNNAAQSMVPWVSSHYLQFIIPNMLYLIYRLPALYQRCSLCPHTNPTSFYALMLRDLLIGWYLSCLYQTQLYYYQSPRPQGLNGKHWFRSRPVIRPSVCHTLSPMTTH